VRKECNLRGLKFHNVVYYQGDYQKNFENKRFLDRFQLTQETLTCDIVLVVGDKDRRFIRLTLATLIRNWQPINQSNIFLVTNKRNFKHIKFILKMNKHLKSSNVSITLINREKWTRNLPFYADYNFNSYLSQRYLKLFSFKILKSNYVWFVDSDYLFLRKMNEESLFTNGSFIWKYRRWLENSRSQQYWGKTSEFIWGRKSKYQFMLNTPYCFKVSDLIMATNSISKESVRLAGMEFSEFQFLGEYAFENKLAWVEFSLVEKSNINSDVTLVHQDQTSGDINFEKTSAIEADSDQSYLVFWSGFPDLDLQLLETLKSNLSQSEPEFLELIKRVHKVDSVDLLWRNQIYDAILDNFCYSDGWTCSILYFRCRPGRTFNLSFFLAPGATVTLQEPTNPEIELVLVDNLVKIRIPFLLHSSQLRLKFESRYTEIPTGRILYAQIQE